MKEFKKNWLIVMCICLVAFCGLMMSGNSSTAVKAEDTDIEIEREIKTENNEDELSPMASTNVTSTAGRITWRYKDSNDVKPLRTVKVEICKKSGSSYTVLGTVYTNTNGYYSLDSHQSVSSDNIVLRIYPESVFCKVYSYAGSSPTAYVREVSAGTVSGNKKTINYSVIICNAEDDDIATCSIYADINKMYFDNALMAQQLINFSGRYVKEIHGQNLNKINVYYPHNNPDNNGSFYKSRSINLKFSTHRWFDNNGIDTVMHEYGHYIAYSLNLVNSVGGYHGANVYDVRLNTDKKLTKSEALRLAWSEGIATYFSEAAQHYYKNEAVGWSTTFAEKHNSVKRPPCGYGEMGEDTTIGVLTALCGFNEEYIDLGLGDKKTLNIIKEFVASDYGKANENKHLSQFVKFLYTKNYIDKEALGYVLTEYEAAPLIKNVERNGNNLTVTFIANGGSENIKNNMFDIVLYDGNGEEILRKNNVNSTSEDVTENISGQRLGNLYEKHECVISLSGVNFEGNTFSVSVIGYQTELGVNSGGYYSRFYTVERSPVGEYIDVGYSIGDEKYCEFVDLWETNGSNEYYLYFPTSGRYTIQTLGMTANQIALYNASNGEQISSANGNGYLCNSLIVVDVYNSQDYKLVVTHNCNTINLTGNVVIYQKRNIKVVITPSETAENNQSASGIYSYHYPDVETILSIAQYKKTNMCTLSVENGGMTKIKTNTYGDHYDTCLYLANVYSMFDATITDSLDSNYSAEINQVLFTGRKYLLVNSLYNLNLLNYSFAIDISQ